MTVVLSQYCLPNGDTGIICTLDTPIYLTAIIGESVFFLDREAKNKVLLTQPRVRCAAFAHYHDGMRHYC